jgi:large subunit ribosomal protein L31
MAKSNDTTYYPDATAKCTNCGSVYTLGSTIQTLSVEICGHCHPFYTGKAVLVDTAGRIDKFKSRLDKVQTTTKSTKSKSRKQMQSISDLMTETPEVVEKSES